MKRITLLAFLCFGLLVVSATVTRKKHEYEYEYDEEAPHRGSVFSRPRNVQVSWKEMPMSKWSPKHVVDWFSNAISSYVPTSLMGNDDEELSFLQRQKEKWIGDLPSLGIDGAQLLKMAKEGATSTKDIFRDVMHITDPDIRAHLMSEIQKAVKRGRPYSSYFDVVEDEDKYERRMRDEREDREDRDVRRRRSRDVEDEDDEGRFSFLTRRLTRDRERERERERPWYSSFLPDFTLMSLLFLPLRFGWFLIKSIINVVMGVLEVSGLLYLVVYLFSPRGTINTVLDSATSIIPETFNIYNSAVTHRMRKMSTQGVPQKTLSLPTRIVIGAVLSILASIFSVGTLFTALAQAAFRNSKILATGVGLFAVLYAVLPNLLWAPLSFFLWRIGDIGGALLFFQFFKRAYEVLRQHLASPAIRQQTTTPQTVPVSSYNINKPSSSIADTATSAFERIVHKLQPSDTSGISGISGASNIPSSSYNINKQSGFAGDTTYEKSNVASSMYKPQSGFAGDTTSSGSAYDKGTTSQIPSSKLEERLMGKAS